MLQSSLIVVAVHSYLNTLIFVSCQRLELELRLIVKAQSAWEKTLKSIEMTIGLVEGNDRAVQDQLRDLRSQCCQEIQILKDMSILRCMPRSDQPLTRQNVNDTLNSSKQLLEVVYSDAHSIKCNLHLFK